MRIVLGRRRSRGNTRTTEDLGARVLSVVWDDDEAAPAERAAARERAFRELRAIVAEAVIWQDEANEVLAAISRREPLAEVAPRGGPLVRRFYELRDRLTVSDDFELRRFADVLGPVFDHHALMLSSSLEMLAAEWRSDRVIQELERITDLGAPAKRLDDIYSELTASAEPVP